MLVCVLWYIQSKFCTFVHRGGETQNTTQCDRVVSHAWIGRVTRIKESCHVYEGDTSHTESMGLQRNGTGLTKAAVVLI